MVLLSQCWSGCRHNRYCFRMWGKCENALKFWQLAFREINETCNLSLAARPKIELLSILENEVLGQPESQHLVVNISKTDYHQARENSS